MSLTPHTLAELQESLQNASTPVGPINLSAFNTVKEHIPEDMTATVQCGMTLAAFQSQIGKHGQWLPVDPPGAEQLSISDLLMWNHSGPRRLGFGTIRDWLIGIRYVSTNGELVFNGGKVVKNVAGFDLCKLLVGSQGTLGVAVEATFKLAPIPECEQFCELACDSLAHAKRLMRSLRESKLHFSVLDLVGKPDTNPLIITGFSGAQADVAAQTTQLQLLSESTKSALAHDQWRLNNEHHVASVPPASLINLIQDKAADEFVARAGNGVVYLPGPTPARTPSNLEQRIKALFDPKEILPPL